MNNMNLFEFFIYPTYYHFVASIIILYVIYYFIIKNKNTKKKILPILGITIVLQIVFYIAFYNKTYYHIDTVREPMIRFLFMEAMLLGAYFRKEYEKYNKNKISNWIFFIITLVLYFITKISFSKGYFVQYQLLNQIILLITLYFLFRSFAGINSKLEKTSEKMKKVIQFIASITLEIYLVQYPIIPIFAGLVFPINWILITTTILISAYILHVMTKKVINLFERINKNESADNRVNKI